MAVNRVNKKTVPSTANSILRAVKHYWLQDYNLCIIYSNSKIKIYENHFYYETLTVGLDEALTMCVLPLLSICTFAILFLSF